MWKFYTFACSAFSGLPRVIQETTSIGWNTFASIFDGITSQFSVSNIVALLGGLVAFCITFVFLWWGVKKGFAAAMRAVKSGKFRL